MTVAVRAPGDEGAGSRVLWVARNLPYPLTAGAGVYSAHLVGAVAAAGARVRFLGYGDPAGCPDVAGVEWVAVPGARRSNRAGVASTLPVAAAVDGTASYRNLLGRELAGPWDAVVLDEYGSGWALPAVLRHRAGTSGARPRLVHVAHNHEELLWREMSRRADVSRVRRAALWQNYRKVRALERRLLREVDLLSAITEEDRRSLPELSGAATATITLSPGYDGAVAPPRSITAETPRRAVIVGSYRWAVKQENLVRFLEVADPVLSAAGVELDVVGDVDEGIVTRFASARAVRFRGFVDDLEPCLSQARVAVAPEMIGGGFKLKLLDYVFGRVPVASITAATAGLPDAVRREVICADDAASLAHAIVAHIDRVDELDARQGRAFEAARSLFRWQERGDRLLAALTRLDPPEPDTSAVGTAGAPPSRAARPPPRAAS